MVLSLPLLFCESPVSVKEHPDEKNTSSLAYNTRTSINDTLRKFTSTTEGLRNSFYLIALINRIS